MAQGKKEFNEKYGGWIAEQNRIVEEFGCSARNTASGSAPCRSSIDVNPNVSQRQIFPFVIQIQHDFYETLPTMDALIFGV